jgi:hypothetical protein
MDETLGEHLRGLQSLPDCSFTHREVTEPPDLRLVEPIIDNVVQLIPRVEPDDLRA